MTRSSFRLLSTRTSGVSRRRAAGFTLPEILVTLIVMSVVVIGILAFFDLSNKLARSQLNVAEMQTVQRIAQQEIAQMLAMAGVGGLPEGIDPAVAIAQGIGTFGVFPTGLALAVTNNVPAGVDLGDALNPLPVMPGTDILTLRGVFSTPVYYLEPQVPLTLDPATGTISLNLNFDVDVGVTQDLDPLREALATPRPEAFVVYDRYNPGAFAVLEYVAGASTLGAPGDATMTLVLSLGAGATYANEYGRLVLGTSLLAGAGGDTWNLPDGTPLQLPRDVGAIGLLEEYRFFVRQEREIPELPASRLKPLLSRARFLPGTNALHVPERAVDLADNIIDLQIALGVDVPILDGAGNVVLEPDGQILEVGAAADDDELLYNFPGDDDALGNIATSAWAHLDASLLFVRLNTLSQADRPDRDYPGAILEVIEDHDYSAPPSIFNAGNYTRLRKRLLTTTIELRNLP